MNPMIRLPNLKCPNYRFPIPVAARVARHVDACERCRFPYHVIDFAFESRRAHPLAAAPRGGSGKP